MEILSTYFTGFTDRQREQFEHLGPLYREWNERINVVSRKDIDALYKHHVLHSLAVARLIAFKPGTRVLDLGSGGGFPGIPLAIAFPEAHFVLVDSRGKKLTVVNEVAEAIGLTNVETHHTRVEEFKAGRASFDFVVSRAVAKLPQLWSWARPMLTNSDHHALPNGLIAFKGGNSMAMKSELKSLHRSVYREVFPIRDWFKDEYFWEKFLVYCN